ncbi:cytochrome P450 [Streptomyces albidoflavus]
MFMPVANSPGCPFTLGTSGDGNHAEASFLRAAGPAPSVILPGGLRARAIVSGQLARRLLLNSAVSRDARMHSRLYVDGELNVDGVIGTWVSTHNALNSYGEDHRRLRRPLAAALAHRQVKTMEPLIGSVVRAALDEIDRSPEKTIDLMDQYARKVPLAVMASLLGIRESLRNSFQRASSGLFATDLPPSQAAAHHHTMSQLLSDLIAEKRQHPDDDLASDLIAAADQEDQALSDAELRDQILLLISAGTETTVTSIATLLADLLGHPEEMSKITEGAATLEDALEESLRRHGPIASVPLRFAVTGFTDEATGESFEAGEPILINFASAGRDEELHGPTAPLYDITRPTSREHLAFGLGAHLCPGAPLARRETLIAVREWLHRFPKTRLAPGGATPLPSWITNGYAELRVTPRGSEDR